MRKYHLVTTLVVSSLAWTFILPVVHLACGMDMQHSAQHSMEHAASANVTHEAGATHHGHGEAPPCADLSVPADGEHGAVECCWVETSPVERATSTTILSPVPGPAPSCDVPEPDEPSDEGETAAVVHDPAPRIPFQLLFSVFLI